MFLLLSKTKDMQPYLFLHCSVADNKHEVVGFLLLLLLLSAMKIVTTMTILMMEMTVVMLAILVMVM